MFISSHLCKKIKQMLSVAANDPYSLIFFLVVSKPLIYMTFPCPQRSHRDSITSVHLFPATVGFLDPSRGYELCLAMMSLRVLPLTMLSLVISLCPLTIQIGQIHSNNQPSGCLQTWLLAQFVLPFLLWYGDSVICATFLEDELSLSHFIETPSPIKALTFDMIIQLVIPWIEQRCQ